MTVISTIITRHCTAHASDSFLTELDSTGARKVVEERQSKLVRVPALRGIMGYWGLARFGAWNTFDWLQTQANDAARIGNAGAFAGRLATELNLVTAKMRLPQPTDAGLGIHFTAYERFDDRWVPEFFIVSNWADATYRALSRDGFRACRQTYAALRKTEERPEDADRARRLEVHAALQNAPLMFLFNNGDPVLFNPIANAILETFVSISGRGQLKDGASSLTHLSIVRAPVDTVSKLLTDCVAPNARLIGGRPHDLAVSPSGVYESRTGD